MTKIEFIQMIAKNHNSGKWINGTFDVEGMHIGVKAYGKWIQRMEGNCKPYFSGAECKTVSAFKSQIESGLNYIFQ
mgnify:CR=1 FL=1